MFFHAKTQKHYPADQAFTLDGTFFPANWLKAADPADLKDLGFEPVVTIGTPESTETHFVSEELVGAERRIINVPRPATAVTSAEVDAESPAPTTL